MKLSSFVKHSCLVSLLHSACIDKYIQHAYITHMLIQLCYACLHSFLHSWMHRYTHTYITHCWWNLAVLWSMLALICSSICSHIYIHIHTYITHMLMKFCSFMKHSCFDPLLHLFIVQTLHHIHMYVRMCMHACVHALISSASDAYVWVYVYACVNSAYKREISLFSCIIFITKTTLHTPKKRPDDWYGFCT
jgi:hypothetical protein